MSHWIQFESRPKRFHAVYVEAMGGYFTFCSRFIRQTGVKAEDRAPKLKCCCCKSRRRLPYLIPVELKTVKAAADSVCVIDTPNYEGGEQRR